MPENISVQPSNDHNSGEGRVRRTVITIVLAGCVNYRSNENRKSRKRGVRIHNAST